MGYDVIPKFRAQFGGQVHEVYLDGRRVGMVYRDPNPPAELAELWMVMTQGTHAVGSYDEGIGAAVAHGEANPDFVLQ